ncbi:hypothetical protein [Bradyrhizobium sp.]|uniref:hypothetical protein n=1 Tax=Bradyrhizobium sp. TaxID=376 RepID=UPI0025C39D39|nr:hypothetical protein [Bradyrhizobium sp.]
MNIVDGSQVPAAEIEAAADALRILWESDENKRALKETGAGANWLWQARLALEAALAVRGKAVQGHHTEQ